jgi:glycine/D-amino acid oxidase-like deaminating enzyme
MAQVSIDPATDSLSYWHATADPLVPSQELPSTSEIVVIGSGLLGCWTAYWLARGGASVTLIERTAIGWGATGRNGGFLVGGTALNYPRLVETVGRDAARGLHQITLEGQALAYEVVAEEEIDCDLRRNGTLHLSLDAETAESITTTRDVLEQDGFRIDVLDRQQVQDLIDTPLADEIIGGTYAPEDGLLHSSRYLAGIARAAERRGVRLVQATVTALTPLHGKTLVGTTCGSIEAGRVVVALNAWSDTLVPELAGLIVPTRGQILAYEPSPRVFNTATGADITPTGEYWQQTLDGSIVIGGHRASAPNGGMDIREMIPTEGVTSRIEDILPGLFPELNTLKVARRWAGLMAFTSDRLPVVDAVPSIPGAWLAGGFNGHGMTFGPRIGQILAEAVTTGKTPEPLAPLRIDRPSLTRLA